MYASVSIRCAGETSTAGYDPDFSCEKRNRALPASMVSPLRSSTGLAASTRFRLEQSLRRAVERGDAVRVWIRQSSSTVAFDDLELPTGKHDNVWGGSASYASLAASLFTTLDLVGEICPYTFVRAKLALERLRDLGNERPSGRVRTREERDLEDGAAAGLLVADHPR